MPRKAQEVLLVPNIRYRVLYGGRGSGKSYAFANRLITLSFQKKRILCVREIQTSIRDSVYRLLCDRIYAMKLERFFIIQRDSIRSVFGAEFIFRGLKTNISEIKSLEGVDIVWCEEAEKISQESWDVLIPTIRQENSEIWISFNPDDERSPTYQMFVEAPVQGIASAFINYDANELFPNVLRREMEWCLKNDIEKYEHVWGGRPKKYGQAVIFKNKLRVEDFIPADEATTQFYYGADWGFGSDPSCLVRMFIRDRILYLDQEFYGYGIEIDDLPRCFDTVGSSRKFTIRGDSSRPDTISYMANQGFMCIGAEKGKDSVEDGIEFLKNFEAIIVHPNCTGSAGDFGNYRWKVDRITEEVLPIPVDKSNHAVDAARYALEPYSKGQVSIYDIL